MGTTYRSLPIWENKKVKHSESQTTIPTANYIFHLKRFTESSFSPASNLSNLHVTHNFIIEFFVLIFSWIYRSYPVLGFLFGEFTCSWLENLGFSCISYFTHKYFFCRKHSEEIVVVTHLIGLMSISLWFMYTWENVSAFQISE